MRPLTDRQEAIVRLLYGERRAWTANEIGYALGFHTGQRGGRTAHDGRTMGPANRVIFSIVGLRDRGLIGYAQRRSGLSGGADVITEAGIAYVEGRHSDEVPRDAHAERA